MSQNILIVDDDICLAYAIQSYIASDNKKIFIVHDSYIAFELLSLYSFDLVISDIAMPHMNGYQLLSMIRLDDRLSTIPVVFLTAKGMTNDRVKAYELGCTAYLTKPFHPLELLAVLDNQLSYSSNTQELDFRRYGAMKKGKNINLTHREESVLALLMQGMMNREIAEALSLSIRNVEKHVSRLLFKTGARNRTELSQIFFYSQGE
uniref:TctD-like protein n=1 Tax=Neogoniolithon spectabile TaxID=231755 RepID=A0A3G3MGM7_9FLOR|nr:hypothetical protein [Neogoniolithon spectabile]AYR05986.1 hypothetical protein [Neogoniolithon spectabile]